MSVASHLNIRLEDYDARIRTFIPGYEQMLDAGAAALRALEAASPVIVDLGTGTGALAARCLAARPGARLIAIDEDAAILEMARARLGAAGALASFLQGSFLDLALPPCDAVVASLALHHVHDADRKGRLYRDCAAALAAGGLLVSVDCFVSSDARLAALEREAWHAHLRLSYSAAEADGYFDAWRREDRYFPLLQEVAMLREAGFEPDVVWRAAPFAVLVGRRR